MCLPRVPAQPLHSPAALPEPQWGSWGAAHLLTLVVTDGKLIQDKVPPLPALPLETRREFWRGAQPCPSPQSIPGPARTHHVALFDTEAALERGRPRGRAGGRGGDVTLRAPQQRVGGQLAALPAVLQQRERTVTVSGRTALREGRTPPAGKSPDTSPE